VDEEEDMPPGSAAVRLLMENGTLAAIHRWLVRLYPDVSAHAEDAVVDGVVRFLAARASGREINEPAAWIRVTARNRVLNLLERQVGRETEADGLEDFVAQASGPTAEDKDVFRYLKGLIERWPSGRLRVITLLYLEAGCEQEPLSQQEAAEMASAILGEDVPWTVIGKTRQRGFERLRAEILAIASQTGINPVTGEETA
jgi:DNA-directed RNA polymerase specialized sigma24 family protein